MRGGSLPGLGYERERQALSSGNGPGIHCCTFWHEPAPLPAQQAVQAHTGRMGKGQPGSPCPMEKPSDSDAPLVQAEREDSAIWPSNVAVANTPASWPGAHCRQRGTSSWEG